MKRRRPDEVFVMVGIEVARNSFRISDFQHAQFRDLAGLGEEIEGARGLCLVEA
jgi:hypothetical protein